MSVIVCLVALLSFAIYLNYSSQVIQPRNLQYAVEAAALGDVKLNSKQINFVNVTLEESDRVLKYLELDLTLTHTPNVNMAAQDLLPMATGYLRNEETTMRWIETQLKSHSPASLWVVEKNSSTSWLMSDGKLCIALQKNSHWQIESIQRCS